MSRAHSGGGERMPRSSASGVARHGRLHRPRWYLTLLKFAAAALAVLLVSGTSVAAIAVYQLESNITGVALPGEEVAGVIPQLGSYDGGFNMLIVGSDTRVGSGEVGPDSELNDVTMLVHVAEDQTSAVVVSIPRDMVVPIPSCPAEDGSGSYDAMSAMPINNTLSYGGLACTVLTVEALTGLDIPYAGLITFQGVIEMSNAVGGVDVCVDGPYSDSFTGLSFPEAGTYTVQGRDAELFLRSRHAVGDGSDLGRISSQQVFLSALVRKIKDNGTLTNLPTLFGLASAATSNMTLSNSMKNANTLVSMALVFKDIPLERITFVQYPGVTGGSGVYAGKVQPLVGPATELLDRIRADESFSPSGTGVGAVAGPTASPSASAPAVENPAPTASDPAVLPSASPSPSSDVIDGVVGQTAAQQTCSRVFN